jgi:hypothetical protein
MTARKRGRKAGNAKHRRGRTAPGPLTPQGGNAREAAQQAIAAKRRARAMDLYVLQRLPMARIAEVLTAEGMPCTGKTVCTDIHRAFDECKAETAAIARHGIDAEIRRLDQIDRQLLPLATGMPLGDTVTVGTGKQRRSIDVPVKAEPRARLQLDALAQVRRNGESRRKLLGLDKQPDEGYVALDTVVAMVRGLVSDVLALTEAHLDLRKPIGDAMRRRFGVIDVDPVERP